jgi:hypothetical protein
MEISDISFNLTTLFDEKYAVLCIKDTDGHIKSSVFKFNSSTFHDDYDKHVNILTRKNVTNENIVNSVNENDDVDIIKRP